MALMGARVVQMGVGRSAWHPTYVAIGWAVRPVSPTEDQGFWLADLLVQGHGLCLWARCSTTTSWVCHFLALGHAAPFEHHGGSVS